MFTQLGLLYKDTLVLSDVKSTPLKSLYTLVLGVLGVKSGIVAINISPS